MVTLTMKAATRSLKVEVVVIDTRSAYSTIMGRGWIHEMEGVASTLYQVMRCLAPDGSETIDITRDQLTNQRCYNIAIHEESNSKGKQEEEESQ